MPMSIDYYINAVVEKSDNYLNLTSLDFSAETPEMIARFCLWLQNHLYITEILWMDHLGRESFIGRINPQYLIQIFNAIQNNPYIQRVGLYNCHLEELTDVAANAAIGNCLATKSIVKITGNRATRTEFSSELLLPIARGATTNLELGFIYWRGGEEAFFDALIAQKYKTFERIALVNNTANWCSPEQLAGLCSLKVSVLDLSHNELMLNYLSSYDEWQNIITQIEANGSLYELNLKNTYRAPFRDEAILLLQEIKPLLLMWIQNTHLTRLDISMNGWDETLIKELRAIATQRSPTLLNLKLLCCEDDYEVEIYGLEDKADSSPETTVTAASAAGDEVMAAPTKFVLDSQLSLYKKATTTPPESSNGSLPGVLEEQQHPLINTPSQYMVY